ncbi:MAG: tetratricopeptide repeat protein [Spirochaetota bacterium]
MFHLNSLLAFGADHPSVDHKKLNRMLAECHDRTGNLDEAAKAYAVILKIDPQDVDANYRLGMIERGREKDDKAAAYFERAVGLQPDHGEALRELSELYFHQKKYHEALGALKRAYPLEPNDPTVNFCLAEILYQYHNPKRALPHYLKARADGRYAVRSLQAIAAILREQGKLQEARRIASIALKMPKLKRDQELALRYELGEVCLAQSDLPAAIEQWEKILSVTSRYRDVAAKLEKYEQTKSNSALRLYMTAGRQDFQNLCARIIEKMLRNVTIIRTEPLVDSTLEVLVQAVHNKAPTTVLFKFFRSSNVIGQFAVREFYEKLKELKARRGICFTNTDFSEDSYQFSEGRVLELFGKKQLVGKVSKVM